MHLSPPQQPRWLSKLARLASLFVSLSILVAAFWWIGSHWVKSPASPVISAQQLQGVDTLGSQAKPLEFPAANPEALNAPTKPMGGVSSSGTSSTDAFSGSNVTLKAVPEPNSLGMLAASIVLAVGLQRFRRRRG